MRLIYHWMEYHDTGQYSAHLKVLLCLNKGAWSLWSLSPTTQDRLTELVFQVRVPCLLNNGNVEVAKCALKSLDSSRTEVECMVEGALIDKLPSTFVNRCVQCLIELNRQYQKLKEDMRYMLVVQEQTRQVNERNEERKRKREEAQEEAAYADA